MDLNYDKISQELKVRPEVLSKLISSFADSLSGKIKSLEEALSQNDASSMRAILHEIKGTSGNLRLTDLSAAENKMHVAVKAGEDKAKLEQYFIELKGAVEELQQYLANKR